MLNNTIGVSFRGRYKDYTMKDRIVKAIQHEIVTFDDGYKYYCPTGNKGGWSSYDLRIIADYLDELNKSWNDQVNLDIT